MSAILEDFRAPDRARRHALEPSGFHGLFRHLRLRPGNSGRDAVGGAEHERHAVEDLAGRDRTGAGDARMAAALDGAARSICSASSSTPLPPAACTPSPPRARWPRPKYAPKAAQRDLILYTSEQSHSSIEKGAIAIGIGQKNVRKIPVDAEFRMRPEALAEAIERDRAARPAPVLRGGDRGHHFHHQHRSG